MLAAMLACALALSPALLIGCQKARPGEAVRDQVAPDVVAVESGAVAPADSPALPHLTPAPLSVQLSRWAEAEQRMSIRYRRLAAAARMLAEHAASADERMKWTAKAWEHQAKATQFSQRRLEYLRAADLMARHERMAVAR